MNGQGPIYGYSRISLEIIHRFLFQLCFCLPFIPELCNLWFLAIQCSAFISGDGDISLKKHWVATATSFVPLFPQFILQVGQSVG